MPGDEAQPIELGTLSLTDFADIHRLCTKVRKLSLALGFSKTEATKITTGLSDQTRLIFPTGRNITISTSILDGQLVFNFSGNFIKNDGTFHEASHISPYFNIQHEQSELTFWHKLTCLFTTPATVTDELIEACRKIISQISEAEFLEQIEAKNQALELRNEELKQFAYIASHDLQEPLRTVLNYISIFTEDYSKILDEDGIQIISAMNAATLRMSNLIRGLLDYSTIGKSAELDHIDCNSLIEEIKADLRLVLDEKKVVLEVDKLPVVVGYRTELRQLFQNLLSNAIKFCNKGVVPIIKIKSIEEPKKWHFLIEDNGIGIDKKHFKKIFEIFNRLNNRKDFSGSGIGLAHCRKIAELHNGTIWVESEYGNGSTFHFTIAK